MMLMTGLGLQVRCCRPLLDHYFIFATHLIKVDFGFGRVFQFDPASRLDAFAVDHPPTQPTTRRIQRSTNPEAKQHPFYWKSIQTIDRLRLTRLTG
jgi:hypothetical protein